MPPSNAALLQTHCTGLIPALCLLSADTEHPREDFVQLRNRFDLLQRSNGPEEWEVTP